MCCQDRTQCVSGEEGLDGDTVRATLTEPGGEERKKLETSSVPHSDTYCAGSHLTDARPERQLQTFYLSVFSNFRHVFETLQNVLR